jgi:hypothetical protein
MTFVAAMVLLSCASSNKKQPPPAAGATGWSVGDPLTTPVSDGSPLVADVAQVAPSTPGQAPARDVPPPASK